MTPLRLTAVAAVVALVATPALARPRQHNYAPAAGAYGTDAPYGPSYYRYGSWEADVIARRAAENQAAPGVTNELAPDNKATATGGPVGGVPGFSGR